MAYKGYIVKVDNLRPHNNADRLQIATFFGNDVVVGFDTYPGEIGIYFPSDGQLSEEFCNENNLVRRKDESGNNVGGYLDPDKRNIKAIRLRGEKSDGIFINITSLAYTGANLDDFNIGDTIDIVNGHEICKKYIPRSTRGRNNVGNGNRTRKKKVPIAPLFAEHADTEQLAYNLGAFKIGDEVEITLKMHGTSQRTGYLPVLKGYRRTIWDRICGREGKPIYDWGYVSGTRRTVLENYEGGFYGDNAFRQVHHDKFVGKLWKGETVYYEVVGWAGPSTPIMDAAKNSKVGKDFVKQYGDITYFSYGCEPGQSECYVYRMTICNEDGDVVEYTPDFMRYRCEQMGVKTVPVFTKFILGDKSLDINGEITPGEFIKEVCEDYYDGPDPIGKTHIREGVVARIVNRPKFTAFKDKNFSFKVLENIIKDTATEPDMEEAQEVENNEGN
jgi:hypothetical protein